MTTEAPPRSLDQRMEALRRANAVRVYRAGVKQQLRDTPCLIVGILTDPPPELATAKVYDLLMAARKMGRAKVTKLLNKHRVSAAKTIAGLSVRQRTALVEELRSTYACR